MRLQDPATRWAASIYGFGIVMLGATSFAYHDVVLGLEPIPTAFGAARMPLAYAAGAVLVVAGAALAARREVRLAGQAIGVVLSLWLLLNVAAVAGNIRSGGKWVCAFETLSLWSAAWAIVGSIRGDEEGERAALTIPVPACVAALGAACVVFGISHFVYIDYVASVLPAWLPWHRFWGYGTGVAHLAAGVALLTRIQARLAATLLGVMFGSWVLMLHLPRVIEMPHTHSEWTSMFVALAMCGTSFVIATVLAPVRAPLSARSSASLAQAR